MRKHILRILALALVFAILIPSASMIGNEQSEDETITVMVIFPSSAVSTKGFNYADYVDRIIAPYESFILAEIDQKQKDYLEANGATIVIEENLYTIGIEGYRFDTRVGEPNIKEDLRFKPRVGNEGHYLVQFVGPIKNEWLNTLRKMGAEPISYYPYNAMLVKAIPEAKTSLGGFEYVQWVGSYHPAYKIRPVLNELNDGAERDVKIITYEPEGIGTVLSGIDKTDIIRGYKGSDFGLVKARLSVDEIERVAALKEVSYIEPIYEMKFDNANMQWVLQTNIMNDRKIWEGADGIIDTPDDLKGEGQIITYADTGLDYDHRMFRESLADIVIPGHDIYNVTNTSRRKVIRYQPMALWYEERGIDRDGDGIPETQEDPNNDGILEAYADSWPYQAMSGHGTLVSGTGAGRDDGLGGSTRDGGAKGAQIYLQDIGSVWQNPQFGGAWDDYLTWIPDDYYWLFIDPYNNGSRIHSNSWGARNSDYDLEAMMVDKFMWEYPDFLILSSNGNGGPCTGPFHQYDVGSPATAKSIISVGSARNNPNQNSMASYSSCGPTTDGRMKPTISAVGDGYSSVSSGDPHDNIGTTSTGFWGGTSYASPAASSLAAMIREYFEKGYYPNGLPLPGNEFYPTAALVKAMIIASGEMMTGSYADGKPELKYPNNSQGWGRPLLDNALYFTGDTRNLLVVDNTDGLSTGQVVEYEFNVTSDSAPLKVFLAWNDYPGAPGASPAIVNNLNLQLEAPNGTTFWGNRFASASIWQQRGYSLPGGLPDSINTNEGVNITTGNAFVDNWLQGATAASGDGVWKARVIAQNVPAGPQPFGLVVTGDLNLSYGIVTIDKKVYSESDTINIEVRDSDLLAPNNIVTVTSTTETAPETVTLTETVAGSGIWRGSIDTEFGLPIPDGKLQVKEGDTITVSYNDISPVHVSTATALVDSSGPVITNVAVKDKTNAYAKITWDTDEPGTSKVYYGETPNLENTPVEITALMVSHEVELIGLTTDTIYYFDVESSDWFGHTTRDDNGGLHYTFRTTEKAEILVVYGDETFDREHYYRNALDGSGWTYNEWYAAAQGDPTLLTLQEYKVVIWQTGYEQYPPFEDSQRYLLTDYLDNGGRLFLTSHDVQWALGDNDASGWYNTERDSWLKSTLKAKYQIDPRSFTCAEGIGGNPISGSYAGGCPGLGVPYIPNRLGAAGDEVELEMAGGITLPVWNSGGIVDYGGLPDSDPDYIAIQWISSSPNGTAGTGVWGGTPSKIVAFFFEFTRMNAVTEDDPARRDILNKVIIWLLDDRDHPDVQVTFPNGGETFSTSPATISWTATTFGTGINKQSIYYSDNSGQSWMLKADDVGPLATTYDWDVCSHPNGNKYMVKVVVQDDGLPKLAGSDESDSTFSIMCPGGDLEGPVTVPGSVKVWPNFVDSGSTAWFNATIDDSARGNSAIQIAEYFIQCTEPEVSEYGTGINMNAVDASFDTPIEDVTWNGTLGLFSGWYTVWVHGKDAAGNWGTFDSERFLALDGVNPPDLIAPSPPPNVRIALEGASLEDLNITWDKSPDDDLDPTHVEYYDIFYSESYAINGTGYKKLTSVPAAASPNYYHVDAARGNGNPNSYFYYVSARDLSCNYGMNETQLAKYNRTLSTGKNLVSIPLILEDESIGTVLQTAAIEIAWYHDIADPVDPWKSYSPFKAFNELTTVNYTMALWIGAPVDTSIVVAGKVPNIAIIQLQQGWNFVGFPSFILRSVGEALSGIDYERIEGYDVNPPEHLRLLWDNDIMVTGYGYWIKVGTAATWTLTN